MADSDAVLAHQSCSPAHGLNPCQSMFACSNASLHKVKWCYNLLREVSMWGGGNNSAIRSQPIHAVLPSTTETLYRQAYLGTRHCSLPSASRELMAASCHQLKRTRACVDELSITRPASTPSAAVLACLLAYMLRLCWPCVSSTHHASDELYTVGSGCGSEK